MARWIESAPFRPLYFLATAAILVAVGVGGGQIFMENDYVVYGVSGKVSWSTSSGYTAGQFWGLVLQTFFLPAAAIALMTFALHSYKSSGWPAFVRVFVYLSLLFVLVLSATIANLDMTDGLIGCLWDFCIDSVMYRFMFSPFIPTVGTLYFMVLVIFSLMASVLVLRSGIDLTGREGTEGTSTALVAEDNEEERWSLIARTGTVGGRQSKQEWTPLLSSTAVLRREKHRRRKAELKTWLCLLAVFICFFPIFIFCSMAVGNGWEHFSVSNLKSYASSSINDDYGKVWNYDLGGGLILKLFPDVLIYWCYIYAVAGVALWASVWRPLGHFFHSRGALTLVGLRSWSNGEITLVLSLFALMGSEAGYWYFTHGWGGKAIDSKTVADRGARTLGQLANITMGLMVLPISRNGVLQTVFGIGWEAMVQYHRWMGYAFLCLVVSHMVLFWVVYWQEGDFAHDWPIAIPMDYHSDNWTIPLAIVSTWTMFILMYGLSLERVRRRFFEVFYYAHHFFMVVWLVMLWHATSAWYYIVASITLWVFDRAVRFSRAISTVTVSEVSVEGNVTKLSYTMEQGWWGFKSGPMEHEVGQYVFLNVPSISTFEWHPFTISSIPDDSITTHHIKDMGGGTFTHHLRVFGEDMAKLSSIPSTFIVNVDGPYGLPLQFGQYRRLVLVAGGIGITPCYAIFRHLYSLAKASLLQDCLDLGVHLVWSFRSADEALLFQDMFHEVACEEGLMGRFSVELFNTGQHSQRTERWDGSLSMLVPCKMGRPDVAAELFDCKGLGRDALVFACGPNGLVDAASMAAAELGLSFKRETFEL